MNFEKEPLYWVNRLGFLARRELTRQFELAGHQLRAEEWAILMLLWRRDQRSPSELADETIRDRTTMTRFLDGMEKKGWLSRELDPSDRRRFFVCLTPQGKNLKKKLVPIAKRVMRQACKGVEKEQFEVTVSVLETMTQNLLAQKEA